MKRFTIIFSILLVVAFIGTLAFVAASPDFVDPGAEDPSGTPKDSPVWNMTMDDLIDYLEAKGLWNSDEMLPLAEGVATEAYLYNTCEIYWWDVDNLEEGSMEKAAYEDGENINLYGQGHIMNVTRNGPFAINTSFYTGDVAAMLDAFKAFGSEDSSNDPVWTMTLDDLVAYLEEKGYVDPSTRAQLASGVASDMINVSGLEMAWWDLENLDESSEEYRVYQELQEGTGVVTIYGSVAYSLTGNGPFGLHVNPDFAGDVNQLMEDFKAFGHDSSGSSSGSSDDRSAPVWSATLDDLAAYLAENGCVDANDYIKINYGEDAVGMSGYRFSDKIDIVHYDLDAVNETYAEEYDMLAKTGMMTYVNGQVGYYTVNGPFTLHFYEWGKEQVPEDEQAEIIDIFMAFGH